MSAETYEHLNTQTLIGFTAKRGTAWHYRADLQGGESNHYPGPIPMGDVKRRLFHWQAAPLRVAVEVPAEIETMTHVGEDGRPARGGAGGPAGHCPQRHVLGARDPLGAVPAARV